MALISAGKLRPHVGLVVPMAEIGQAMAAIERTPRDRPRRLARSAEPPKGGPS